MANNKSGTHSGYMDIKRIRTHHPAVFVAFILALSMAVMFLFNSILIPATRYNQADFLLNNDQPAQAAAMFSELGPYRDSATRWQEAQYKHATQLLEDMQYAQAARLFSELGDYKDSVQLFAQYKLQVLGQARPGDIVWFGHLEQDNNPVNGQEEIAWRVLEVSAGKALLISEKSLACQAYYLESGPVTWEKSTLRTWLNTTFLTETFTAAEQARISVADLANPDNSIYNIRGGSPTRDQVFLLSLEEANRYFADDASRIATSTSAAISQGAYNYAGHGWWWLRSPGYQDYFAARVGGDGHVDLYGDNVRNEYNVVRPAIWIDLQK